MTLKTIVFGCAAESEGDLFHAAALVESLRRFGGSLARQCFVVLASPAVIDGAREQVARVEDAGAQVVPLSPPPVPADLHPMSLPFSTKTFGAAAAEKIAAGMAGVLAWFDAGSLILHDPQPLVLPSRKAFAYRPVDHTLIGSPHDEPVDAFWQRIYDLCGVPAGRLFPMPTTVDGRVLRPYFNAGLLVVRPERGIFGAWIDNYRRLQRDGVFRPYLEQQLYRIFFHQAVLAGTVLNLVDQSEMILLPPSVSYPLHMHGQHPAASRATSLEQLTTLRHEGLFDQPGWGRRLNISVGGELSAWLAEGFSRIRGDPAPPGNPVPAGRL